MTLSAYFCIRISFFRLVEVRNKNHDAPEMSFSSFEGHTSSFFETPAGVKNVHQRKFTQHWWIGGCILVYNPFLLIFPSICLDISQCVIEKEITVKNLLQTEEKN